MANGDLRLMAYIVERKGMTVDQPLLRAHLNTRLPEHMIPAVWMTLAKMPLSPNGKVDRRALPDPVHIPSLPVVGAISDTEKLLMTLWCRVLDKSSIDPESSFFDLGASSLHVAEVHGELVRHHSTLAITALYQFPTIRLLARHLNDASITESGNTITERARRQLAARRRPPPPSLP